jgi:polysaccharide export outer membrane protein
MMRNFIIYIALWTLTGCAGLNPSTMFETGKDFKYTDLSNQELKPFKISPSDMISIRLFSNEGYKMVDMTNQPGSEGREDEEYMVDAGGMVKLPILGEVKVGGMTEKDAEKMLEEKYGSYYRQSFLILRVTNKKVIVFPGNRSSAVVVNMKSSNTRLIEVLAMAGGIHTIGLSKKIKIIRGNEVQMVDLSDMKGQEKANMLIQPNDIVYVESAPRLSQEALAQISPAIALFSSFLFIYSILFR